MSLQHARDLLQTAEKDEALAAQLQGARDRDELITRLAQQAEARGLTVTADELRQALDETQPPYDVLLM